MNFLMARPDFNISCWLEDNGYTNNPEAPHFIVFGGGADVVPALYGEANTDSYCDARVDAADLREFQKYKHLPKVGICRGFQFLAVMAGNKLKQHIDGHAISGTHSVTHVLKGECQVTSTHHQEVIPTSLDYVPLFVAEDGTCEGGVFKSINAFGVQFHPEYLSCSNKGQGLVLAGIEDLVGGLYG